ncbi:hypothetical protein HOK51_03595 [Candidatus Woesearchaeota archaeon]|jgi:hypothetical protein|nr:hypothetical protein [Candidatus Woesearchaeota archaeon]MBT6518905.1 hypothetical protein [Candidatus Woesearchaeota archaeon]MBT7367573.1 hypothetical protein [Candidatus Woesearchaeota archaeon]
MSYIKSSLCNSLGVLCIGCCGKLSDSKEEVAQGIKKNTLEFKHSVSDKHNKKQLKHFRDRHPARELRNSGVCRNLIYDVDKDLIFCPIHQEICGTDNGTDLRDGHCDTLHLCKAAFLFDLWPKEKRDEFISFLRKKMRKGMCWHKLSKGLDNDKLLYEFEGI